MVRQQEYSTIKIFFLTEHNLSVVTLMRISFSTISQHQQTLHTREKGGICFNQCVSFESLTGQL